MGKRLWWFGLGAAGGCVAAVWGLSSVRRASRRLDPQRVPEQVPRLVRGLGDQLSAALAEGRRGMHEREQQLRAALGHRPVGADR